MNEPTICLNMIVKNESHIIKTTLENICSKINFSYWVICDTGSTDNTCEIIENFFKDKNINGELHRHEWKDFAHNRTLALEKAFNKTDLLFIFDADDEIHGTVEMPKSVTHDGYHLNFGDGNGISYQRILLINNRIKWIYRSVIHEYIQCMKENPTTTYIIGNYYIVSGRKGSRSMDNDKYLKDAKILENAYDEAKNNNDELYLRYGFYCANSYKDAGCVDESIKWYKITLSNDNWNQEKYMSCYHLYHAYLKINEPEKAVYYLMESLKYDNERVECIYELIKYYINKNDMLTAYFCYKIIKDNYENKYLKASSNIHGKLFVIPMIGDFYLPFFMVLVVDKMKNAYPELNETIVKMYEIAFTKKTIGLEEHYYGNLLFNLQFFIDICVNKNSNFIQLFQTYVDFLETFIDLTKFEHFMINFKKYGLKTKSIKQITFSHQECKQSNNILFYTGFSGVPWNYTYSINNALGGSETAVANLSKLFPSDFKIYVAGDVAEENIDNVSYINFITLRNLIKTIPFHTVIVSRYISFYEMFPSVSFYKSYIWGHDVCLLHYGCGLESHDIIKKWNNKINGCICQTEWHKNEFIKKYPELDDKCIIINNGISIDKFIYKPIKISNRFIYTSCSERGLERVIELWQQIITHMPGAELYISSYNNFPSNDFENQLQTKMSKFDSIKHIGRLNKSQLYELMASSEYWLYPTNWPETSCITSMEMLMSEVICIYYPLAGLVDTLGDYGIKIHRDNEIDVIKELTNNKKAEIKMKGKEYALSCSWENRAKTWIKELNIERNSKQDWVFYCESQLFPKKMIKDYILNLNNLFKEYDIHLTDDAQYALYINPSKLTYVHNISNKDLRNKLTNTSFSYLNTEPLNIHLRLYIFLEIFKKNHNIEYYDYSKSNITILNKIGIDTRNFKYIPYVCNNNELSTLNQLNSQTEKIYDFGLIVALGGDITERRQKIVTFLTNNGFKVHTASGWGIDRDKELAKCKCILNIHGFCGIPSAIFEHIRCDRLLESKFNILSEESIYVDDEFVQRYENLKFIKYDDFFNYDIINTYLTNLNEKYN
jgi:glycosyltransferase involved in cell wall biosynthesis